AYNDQIQTMDTLRPMHHVRGRTLMSYVIVYESGTGNTEQLTHAVAAALPSEERLAFGRVDEVDRDAVAQADRVYVGFWTNRGDCSDELAEMLAMLAENVV